MVEDVAGVLLLVVEGVGGEETSSSYTKSNNTRQYFPSTGSTYILTKLTCYKGFSIKTA